MVKCPHCGAEVGEELSFCPDCGKYVETEQSRPAPLDRDDEVPDWYGWLAVLSLSVPIVGLLFLCWWGYRRGRRDALVRPSRALPSYNMENLTLFWGVMLFVPVVNWYALVHLPTLWYKEGLRVGSLGGNPPERFTSIKAVILPIVLAAALIWGLVVAGGTIASSKGSSGGGEPSIEGFRSACVTTCVPTVGESESGREYCDCSCRAYEENYSADELKALENETRTGAWSDAKFREVLAPCVGGWKGPEYPENTRQNFLQECSSSVPEQGQGFCECLLRQLEQRYSLSEYVQMNLQVQQDPTFVPPAMTDAVTVCQ